MRESFKYLRLEISSVLFKSWEEFLVLLRRKNSSLENDYVAFLYCGKELLKKNKSPIPSNIHKFKCSYFIYNENDIWRVFNSINKKSDKYKDAIKYKVKLVKHLNEINERFNEKEDGSDFVWSYKEKEPKTPFKRNQVLQYSIPMITLNAAIVEGALREILARYIQNEINKYIDEGNREGRYTHNNYQKILVSKQIKIESNSSYNSILDEYSVIFGLKRSSLLSKEILVIIDSLFTLRNLFAHGTSIVTTNIPVEHDIYFKNWTTKVSKLQEVLKKYFGSDIIYENISDFRLAEFYMSYSRIYLIKIADFIKSYDESGFDAVNKINIINTLKNERGLSMKYNEYFLELYKFPKS